jgi:hypothetical protein
MATVNGMLRDLNALEGMILKCIIKKSRGNILILLASGNDSLGS